MKPFFKRIFIFIYSELSTFDFCCGFGTFILVMHTQKLFGSFKNFMQKYNSKLSIGRPVQEYILICKYPERFEK